ncbi:hypothetical protein B0H65DRAFT_283303 [Neurospora tetraspora]|uniref:Uncharacterized protein n=1 Tax=Neurospora tetraspora TaxID=94610 RepID=A0AAE0MPL1_9PEZI|nr:hypothetical protein B0H65DRAFT_283303 [Neurospora tetraspora]
MKRAKTELPAEWWKKLSKGELGTDARQRGSPPPEPTLTAVKASELAFVGHPSELDRFTLITPTFITHAHRTEPLHLLHNTRHGLAPFSSTSQHPLAISQPVDHQPPVVHQPQQRPQYQRHQQPLLIVSSVDTTPVSSSAKQNKHHTSPSEPDGVLSLLQVQVSERVHLNTTQKADMLLSLPCLGATVNGQRSQPLT